MFNSNKLFTFTLLALVANASARPIDLPAGQDPSTATHSLNSPHTESIVPMTSSVIDNSSLSAPSQVPTLTDHKDIPTTSAPVLPGTPSVATSTTLSTGAPAVPSAPLDPSIVHSDASAPDYVYCLVHCHPVAPKPSPDNVPEHTMTSGVVEPVPTPTSTDLHGTVSLPSSMGTSLSGLPTTTVVPELGAQTPAARVVETPALATPATTTLPTSASAPSVSAPAVNPPSSAPSISVPASSSSLPASVPVSAPSPPAMLPEPSSVPTIPTDATPSAPAVPTSSASL
ncbi:hypothetical protein C8Q80DRAFT_916656 [Daedaleopsis nitida]|nr:hypothetical protein C8Q80DRAFT_916656 [Daedaleopsis nitida]